MSEYDGRLFVVVNVSRQEPWARHGEYMVMPGEEPHTYGTVDGALGQVADLAIEHGHDLTTAPIFELVPVPITDELLARFEELKAELEEDWEA